MSLSGPIVLAVLFGALLHAAWNALIKSGIDKPLDTALVHSMGIFIAVPLVMITGLPPRAAWPYMATSLLIHIAYYTALAGAYKHGDLSLTYPVMRGCAPLLVAMGSATFIGEAISVTAWIGVALLCVGVVTLGLSRSVLRENDDSRRSKALGFALANAAVIALYTVVDGIGVRVSGNALAYVATLFLFDGIPYMLLVLWRRPGKRRAALEYMAGRWKLALIGSAASLGSYGIALWAMTKAPVAIVAALRETSVLFAALIGTLFLREGFGWQRAAGTLIIVAGVMVLRVG
ncbi:phosphonate utilization associated putative membrane protein [Variovorax sp. PBS-H4]|uniref:EamA family transporter n=1 Tax=Variovorax sp. PBS-H4 TaxID=434008 RepID=UPI0013179179|nr:EamA family transporter [Variovorax sp. PBS-H4]VTU34676.1 phosphonate utilization associated putative membrane protein [Variovorax sp. PBS-H4]